MRWDETSSWNSYTTDHFELGLFDWQNKTLAISLSRNPSIFCWLIHVTALLSRVFACLIVLVMQFPLPSLLHRDAFCSMFFPLSMCFVPSSIDSLLLRSQSHPFSDEQKSASSFCPSGAYSLSNCIYHSDDGTGNCYRLSAYCLSMLLFYSFFVCASCVRERWWKCFSCLFLSIYSRLMMTSHTHAKAFMCDFFSLRCYYVSLGYFLILFCLSRILCLPLPACLFFNVCQSCSFCQGEIEEMRMRENDGKRLKRMKLTNQSGRHEQFTVLSTMKRRRKRERMGWVETVGDDVLASNSSEKRTACEKERFEFPPNRIYSLNSTQDIERQEGCGRTLISLAPFPANVLFCLFQLFSHITLNCECLRFCRVRS